MTIAATNVLTMLYCSGAYLGALSCVFLMQTCAQSQADKFDPAWLSFARRVILTATALSLCYGAIYVARQIAAPWLPNVLLVWCVALAMTLRIITIKLRAPFLSLITGHFRTK